MPTPPFPAPSSTTATPCQVNPQSWSRGTVRQDMPPLHDIANAPLNVFKAKLTAEDILLEFRKECHAHGAASLITCVLRFLHSATPSVNTDLAAELLKLTTFALPDAVVPVFVPSPDPLDPRTTTATDASAHADAVAAHELARLSMIEDVLKLGELTHVLQRLNREFPGKQEFLSLSDRMISLVNAPTPAGSSHIPMPPGALYETLHGVVTDWLKWPETALRSAQESLQRCPPAKQLEELHAVPLMIEFNPSAGNA